MQEGVILLLRASAYLRQAEMHRAELQITVDELLEMIPATENLQALALEASQQATSKNPALVHSILTRVLSQGKLEEAQFRKTQYRHGLYQYSLLHAAQDALRATELLPTYSTSWLRAAEILTQLWKLEESAQYYQRAMDLDASLEPKLQTVLQKVSQRLDLLERARSYGWPEDTLRLALDVTA